MKNCNLIWKRKITIPLIYLFGIFLSGCASFDPQPGMSVAEVSKSAYVPCEGSMRISDQHIVYVGKHPESDNLDVYRTLAREKYGRGRGRCLEELIFRDGKLLSNGDVAVELARSGEQKKQAEKKLAIRKEEMNEIISTKGLSQLPYFEWTLNSDFKIWEDKKGVRYYSINNEFVTAEKVRDNIGRYEQEMKRLAAQKARETQIYNEEREKVVRIQRLESEYRSLGGDINILKLNFPSKACYEFRQAHEYRGCVDSVNQPNSPKWEAELRGAIESLRRKKKAEQDAQIAREKCLGDGAIGICQSSSQNNRIFLCDRGNTDFTLKNIFNEYCYTTDTVNVYSEMDVRNNLSTTVSDIAFECTQFAGSGTALLRRKHTIYQAWQPREVKRVKIKSLKHEQVSWVSCRAVGWR